jgi:hypothetical protein
MNQDEIQRCTEKNLFSEAAGRMKEVKLKFPRQFERKGAQKWG